MNCDAASVAKSETEQEPESDQLGDDFLPKNAYDPHAKRKKRSEIWDYFAQFWHRLSVDSIRASVCLQAWGRFGLFNASTY